MDETRHLLKKMQDDLAGIKENLVRGNYRNQDIYFEVLGEAKSLIKMIDEAEQLIAQRGFDDDSDED